MVSVMITVRELILVGGFDESSVLAGADSLENELLGVTSFDSPDGHRWLRAGEFVLTTGFPFLSQQKTCTKRLITLIDELVTIGTPGLAIKLGRYIEDLPEAVLSHATKKAFPILSFPMNKAWSDVIVPVVQYINDKQRIELDRTHAIYERFHHYLTGGAPISTLTDLLSDTLDAPVSIHVPQHKWKWDSSLGSFPGDDSLDKLYGQRAPIRLTQEPLSRQKEGIHVRWLLHDQIVQGTIIIGQRERDLYAWEKVAIEQTAALLSLEMQRQRAIQETFQRFRNDFLQQLVSGQIVSHEMLMRKADEVGWELSDHYIAMIVSSSPHDKTGMELWQENHHLLNALHSFFSSNEAILYGLDQENRVLLLVPMPIHAPTEPLSQWLQEQCLNTVTKQLDQPVFAGIGRYHPEREGIVCSYREALISLRTALHSTPPANVSSLHVKSYHDLGLERIMYADDPATEAQTFAEECLGKIQSYDRDKNGQLLQTLQVFLQADGNYAEAARRLYVHKNTIKYRIQLIREWTGLNAENGHDQMLLRIAITAHVIGHRL
ncbi:PucR family transcriptional regulator [Brevibacillus porteri]|uniref:Sugar diacid utilization regulator n=2 Tax=Brevibacillus TaxID=55080 RepID=A0ABX5FJ02_9BACL|nr:PucR family transcriptional regulator [Brevibacillus porteri]MED1800091.1 PucR family transcriptional regulator ligand-binding domain-containing protein [Brevibacillus porteri]MED2134501.1 PucR family transcriptional regulator ligand-binding domain-containing protein [Brevibacillus porteri]MED2747174.1 PucR family transcriptional regulator ligand-binding domain-containing protein [Brevibacillus porteri]MED2812462.1 PucR family transcriptional regulator ligand-binding domain-containing protei